MNNPSKCLSKYLGSDLLAHDYTIKFTSLALDKCAKHITEEELSSRDHHLCYYTLAISQ